MDKLRHRYPSIVIQQAVWLYFRFSLSYRDVEDMLAERGIPNLTRVSRSGYADMALRDSRSVKPLRPCSFGLQISD